MSIIKRNGESFPMLPAFFNDFFTRDLWDMNLGNQSSTNTSLPAVNIKENSKNFIVEMAAPGMNKEDFKVELDNNKLTITSERNEEHEEGEDKRYTHREFSYQSFQRTFQLPKEVVDVDRIEAKYENGLLWLMIPKKEEVKQKAPKTIAIA